MSARRRVLDRGVRILGVEKKRKRMRLGVKTIYGQTVVLPGERPFELGSC